MANRSKTTCETCQHELAVPSPSGLAADLAAHLETCPTCSNFAAGLDRLDRAWDATRPVEPSPLAFDGLWSRALMAADAVAPLPSASRRRVSETYTVPMSAGRASGRFGWAPRLLAVPSAAAAVLLVSVLSGLLRSPQVTQVAATTRPISVVTVDVEQTVVVRLEDGGAVNVVEIEAPGAVSESDPISPVAELAAGNHHDALNAFEAMAAN